jgi:uncharacterized SAM-binding protein YcdF (DUF218 family)
VECEKVGRFLLNFPFGHLFLLIFILLFAATVSLLVSIYTYSFVTDMEPADAAVVLSAAVIDGEPAPIFAERINHAIALYEAGIVEYIIFTGTYRDHPAAESEAARDYALRLGVPAERIHIETSSRITFENLQQAKLVAEEQQMSRLLLVSDPLHMKRAMRMAGDLGLNASPSPTQTSQYGGHRHKLHFGLRETWLYANYLVARIRWWWQPPPEQLAFMTPSPADSADSG